jgi:protein-tyrosine phosphatase
MVNIDVHSHLIPGIDDGCINLDETLACIRHQRSCGFAGSICTPHVGFEAYPANTVDSVRQQVSELKQELAKRGIEYRLWPGGEVRLTERTISWFRRHGVPTLGEGRFVLVDYWGPTWPSFADKAIDYLLVNDYRPLLAHPERMNLPPEELERTLVRLTDRGICLQGNLRCVAGHEGPGPFEFAWSLLQRDAYFCLATDCHRPTDLSQRLEGLRALSDECGTAATDKLVGDRSQEILGWDFHSDQQSSDSRVPADIGRRHSVADRDRQ